MDVIINFLANLVDANSHGCIVVAEWILQIFLSLESKTVLNRKKKGGK